MKLLTFINNNKVYMLCESNSSEYQLGVVEHEENTLLCGLCVCVREKG